MDINRFKEIESRFTDLKSQLAEGKINTDSYKLELKKLMMQDEQGRYWMIGGKSGSWYIYENNEWKSANPFPGADEAAKPAEPKKAEAATVEKPVEMKKLHAKEPPAKEKGDEISCKYCGSKIPVHAQYCTFCGGNQKKVKEERSTRLAEGIVEFKSIHILSLLFFLGGIGIIFGVILGASFGVFNIGGDLIFQFPQMLQETRGKIQGGLIFGAIGGIVGFVSGAGVAILSSLFYNAVAFLFGGVRFRTKT